MQFKVRFTWDVFFTGVYIYLQFYRSIMIVAHDYNNIQDDFK